MELLQLKYFRVVARMEHLSHAARELSVAQPALSMMIARLEESLGVQLFERQGRTIRLNTYGRVFLHRVEEALTALEEGQHELEEMAGREQGSITLMTSSIFSFNEVLKQFLLHAPDTKFRILQSSIPEERMQLLEHHAVDFCLGAPPIEKLGIAGVNLFTEDIVIAVPARHRLANRKAIHLYEVKEDVFISFKKGHLAREGLERFCRQAGFQPEVSCEIEEPAAIPVLVSSGLGIALLPAHAQSLGMGHSMVLLKLQGSGYQRTLQLSWSEKRYLSKLARTFKDFIIGYFADVPDTSGRSEGANVQESERGTDGAHQGKW